MLDLKDYAVLAFQNEEDDIASNTVKLKFVGFKGDAPRVFMYPGEFLRSDREKIRWAVRLLCATVDFDTLAFVSDTYGSTSPTRKNGEEWGVGGMQHAWENDTEDKELVHEALQVSLITRDGRLGAATIPYQRIGESLAWDEEEGTYLWEGEKENPEDKEGFKLGGFFPDVMRDGVGTPNVLDQMDKLRALAEQMNLPEEEARAHMMCAGVKMLASEGVPVAIAGVTKVEEEVIEKSFRKDGPMMNDLNADVVRINRED